MNDDRIRIQLIKHDTSNWFEQLMAKVAEREQQNRQQGNAND